jgi:hypothetical protein
MRGVAAVHIPELRAEAAVAKGAPRMSLIVFMACGCFGKEFL